MTTNKENNKGIVQEISVKQFLAQQERVGRGGSGGNFTAFTSKKKLVESKAIPEDKMNSVVQIIGATGFNLHNDSDNLIITMYNKDEGYKYFVVDLATMKIVILDSMRKAKAYVLDLSKEVAKETPKVEKKEVKKVKDK